MSSHKKGFSLIEVLVSVVVLSIGLTALMAIYFTSLTQQAKPIRILQAEYLAENYLNKTVVLKAWRFCPLNTKPLSLCRYFRTDQILPVDVPVPSLAHFKVTITVSPQQEIATIPMHNIEVSIYDGNDKLATVNSWVAA